MLFGVWVYDVYTNESKIYKMPKKRSPKVTKGSNYNIPTKGML